jgi:hypothetical protein
MKLGIHTLIAPALCGLPALLLVSASFAACAGASDEATETNTEATMTAAEAVTDPITISGTITGAEGETLSGVAVQLNGSAQAHVTTGASGAYTFNGLNAGSYSVQPSLAGCNFAPTVVNLNNLGASTTVDFAGSGATCGGAAAPDGGAATGSLTISGHITDTSGDGVAGVRVALNGSTQGFRVTNAAGAYTFSVSPGSYSLNPSGVCASFTPGVVNLNNLTKSAAQNLTAIGCP